MSIISIKFVLFVFALLIIYYCIPILNAQKVILLAANILFYLSFGSQNLILLFTLILLSYICSLVLRKKPGKAALFLSILFCVAPLLLFKYYNFTLSSLDAVLTKYHLPAMPFPALKLLEPLGISFFTFKIISYLCETYKQKLSTKYSLLDYAIYISFFPTITSGPIDAPETFLQQLKERKTYHHRTFMEGCLIALFGFFEKMIVADRLNPIVNHIFGNYSDYTGFPLLITSILYSLQIYLDFSGYTLIVTGIARTMNIHCTSNFEQPYFSTSIQEFWRRWHISLSTWLKNYIYIPLGGNRKGAFRKNINLLATFFVSGIWHGAGWNFIFWGLLHGCYQVIGGLTQAIRSKLKKQLHLAETKFEHCIQIIITFLLVNFAWVIFWSSQSLITGLHIIRSMFPLKHIHFNWLYDTGISHTEINILLGAGIIIWLIDYLRYHQKNLLEKFFNCNIILRYGILYFLIFSVIIMGYYGAGFDSSAFIYFQF